MLLGIGTSGVMAQSSYGYNYGSPATANPQAQSQQGASSYYYGGQSGAQYPYTQPSGTQTASYIPPRGGYPAVPQQQQDEAPVRYEPQISPYEQPGTRAARTYYAGAPVAGLNRPVNFPRDPGDDVDVLKLQVFLDYHGYSVGEIDGQWGYNTERALHVYQKNNAMPATGQLDDRIMQRLNAFQDGYLLEYTVTSDDVKGPFYAIPRTYPEQGKMKHLPYESPTEALGEKFHCSQTLLRKLNPGVDLDNIQAGQTIMAINTIDGIDDKRGKVSLIKISKKNKWIECFDAEGRFMFYYPSTLGTYRDEIPEGKYTVQNVIFNPPFKYKPSLMWDAKPGEQVVDIPPGPNSPVGAVWIGTSRPSVGIHGTPNPENVSKNFSHGCIRTCNWDTKQLAKRISVGTPIEFVP